MNELDHAASPAPQIGSGVLPPLFSVENWFNKLTTALSVLGACVLVLICIFITVNAGGRLLFNTPWVGITDLEILFVSFVGFASMSTAVIRRESIQIDLIYEKFSGKTRCVLYLFAMQISCIIWFVLAWRACVAGWGWTKYTHILMIDEWPSVFFSGIGMGLVAIAFLFQVLHILRYLIQRKEFALILIGTAATALLCLLPFAYRAAGLSLSGLQLGGLGFILLMVLLLLRVPLGCGMGLIGLIGLLMILRTPTAAIKTIASIPFVQTGTFIMIAFPMFLLMGEMVSLAGLSDDLFDAARKWMGRLPGGLAIASVGGCAGFGAVCGDSLVTVLTMSSVAMPAMKEAHYNNQLSAGSLAA